MIKQKLEIYARAMVTGGLPQYAYPLFSFFMFMDEEKRKQKESNFIAAAREKFGNKFDYSKVYFRGATIPVTIICPIHGEFKMKPYNHLCSVTGCLKCGQKNSRDANLIKAAETFELKARKIHGDKYDYSKVVYDGYDSHVTIICPVHGEFSQKASSHLKGAGCPECGKLISPTKTAEQFIKDAVKIHGNKYDYSKTEYINCGTKVCIICPKHGEFWQTPSNHLNGEGCHKCANEKYVEKNREIFILKAKEKYGDKYDYSKVDYKGSDVPVCIIDPIRGEFWQKPKNHLSGVTGCSLPKTPEYTYEMCKDAAKKCHTIKQFFKNYRRLYKKAKEKGWLNDFIWLAAGTSEYVIYVYEFKDAAYVGLTNNLKRRDYQHRNVNDGQYDGVFSYSEKYEEQIPDVKILENNLNSMDASEAEKKWIEEYKNNGWLMINKNCGGSIGNVINRVEITDEEIIEFAKQCSCMQDMKRKNRSYYNNMVKRGIQHDCFSNFHSQKQSTPYVYTEEFIKSIVEKYPTKNELRKHETRVYQYLHSHKIIYNYYSPERGK